MKYKRTIFFLSLPVLFIIPVCANDGETVLFSDGEQIWAAINGNMI